MYRRAQAAVHRSLTCCAAFFNSARLQQEQRKVSDIELPPLSRRPTATHVQVRPEGPSITAGLLSGTL